MKKKYLVLIAIAAVLLLGYGVFNKQGAETTDVPADVAAHIASKSNLVVVESPLPGEKIFSPLIVRGKARGYWYFEASFPLVLVDWDGRIIAQSYAQAQGEWMTEEFVPFEGKLIFEKPPRDGAPFDRGTVIFQKDNPSGLPEHDDALEIPVFFN